MTYFFIGWFALAIGVEIGFAWHALSAPRCTCTDPDCGGCLSEIDWENANG